MIGTCASVQPEPLRNVFPCNANCIPTHSYLAKQMSFESRDLSLHACHDMAKGLKSLLCVLIWVLIESSAMYLLIQKRQMYSRACAKSNE